MDARTPFKKAFPRICKFYNFVALEIWLTVLAGRKRQLCYDQWYTFDDKGWACGRYSKQIPGLDLQPKIPRTMEWPSKVMLCTCLFSPKWVYSMFISYYRSRFFCGGKLPPYMYNMYSPYIIVYRHRCRMMYCMCVWYIFSGIYSSKSFQHWSQRLRIVEYMCHKSRWSMWLSNVPLD